MNTRVYIITDGDWDDYRIRAFLDGPADADMSKLEKQFNSEVGGCDGDRFAAWLKQHHGFTDSDATEIHLC